MPSGDPIALRLTIRDPAPGALYSLQDKDSHPVEPRRAGDAPLSFDVPVRNDAGRWLGEFVRREGPVRRFVYIAIGTCAGDAASPWTRRAKVDIHEIPAGLVEAGRAGAVLEVMLPGHEAKGGPACATVKPLAPWRAV